MGTIAGPDSNALLVGHNIGHRFTSGRKDPPLDVLVDVTVEVGKGELVAIVGPSGCGKSTLFNILAGLVTPYAGNVFLADKDVTGVTGHAAYMMQRDLLLPWRTVLDNAILGLELAGVRRSQARAAALQLIGKFDLAGFEDYYPAALSGGMRQRAAFMRTVLSGKHVLLLDEPFGALDALTRSREQELLLEVWHDLGHTILFVTHDPREAVFLADRIYVLSRRPSHVREVVPVDLSRPRRLRDIGSAEFSRIERQVLDLLWQEQDS